MIKKQLNAVLSIVMVMLLTACSSGATNNSSATEKELSEVSQTVFPEYLSDWDVQFNETDNEFLIIFGLKSSEKKYISSDGTADIEITDDTGNKIFTDTIPFDESNFSDYTSKLWKGSRYLCGIYIDADKLKPAASDEGVLSITVTAAEGLSVFDTEKIEIYDLPTKDVVIKAPGLTQKMTYTDFDGNKTYFDINDINVDSEIVSGTASAEITVTIKMLENNLGAYNDYFMFGYKLKNSQNVIIESDEEMVDRINSGESVNVKFELYDLDPNDKYIIVFDEINDKI